MKNNTGKNIRELNDEHLLDKLLFFTISQANYEDIFNRFLMCNSRNKEKDDKFSLVYKSRTRGDRLCRVNSKRMRLPAGQELQNQSCKVL